MAERERKFSTVSATEVQRHFRDVLRRLNAEGGPLIIERDGVPAAALVPMEDYEKLVAEQERSTQEKTARLALFDKAAASFRDAVAESGLSEDEILDSLKETRRAVHEKRYGKR